ncbi:hypothetical protein [uncultured Chitinophaga sp.]|uniref:hypothetical protein n=1 Tax=uncultured Chitinophaga sp. TaxID=339340 RepID=UPI0025D6A282|nr:hypothetical protein [uncultured Chitinophaga sp.]
MTNKVLSDFTQFCDSEVSRLKPQADQSLPPGTISSMQSYLTSFHAKYIELEQSVRNETNNVLQTVDNMDNLKQALVGICKQTLNKFTSEYKPI